MNPIGDINIDGAVNVSDIADLIDVLLGSARAYRYANDVDGDGVIGIQDVTMLIDQLLNQTSSPKD